MQWLQLMSALWPVVLQAIQTVAKVENKTPEEAVNDVINHLTPGMPNAPALGEKSKT